ncbi:MAG TPA: S8 family serine peptidase [Vicinamibacterales bacterium]|jgi:serine protease
MFRLPPLVAVGLGLSVIAAPALESQEPELVHTAGTDTAHAIASTRALEEGLPYVPGELLVRFKDGTPQRQSESALTVLHSTISPDNASWLGPVLHLSDLNIDDPVRAADTLSRQPEVLYAQPNYLTALRSVPNDSNYSRQWNMNLINMPQAWDISRTAGSGVTVAVIDSGLTTRDGTFGFRVWTGTAFSTMAIPFAKAADFDHNRVLTGIDLQTFGPWQTPAGEPLIFDAHGHGTHVSGTIAQQTNNNMGYAGVANGVTLMPIKACFSAWDVQLYNNHVLNVPRFETAPTGTLCPTSAVVGGIRYAADNGAKVINISLGGTATQPAELDALNYAVSKGTFVAISAGNDALVGNATHYPAFYASQIEGVMAVGALTPTRERARYSNTGSYVEISAPGGAGSFGTANDQVWQMGPNQADLLFAPLRLAPAFNRYSDLGFAGTSMAAPHVTALAALLYSQGITRPSAIEAAIKRFAIDLGPQGRDDEFGAGMIDARATLRGFGVAR